jgi:hypothetical protein
MANLLVIKKIAWVLAQGFFLPLVLWLNDLRELGRYWEALGVFLLLELLYLVDALLFLSLFGSKKGSK